MVSAPGEVSHEGDAAGVMFIGRVIKTLLAGARPGWQVVSAHEHLPSSRLQLDTRIGTTCTHLR
jgi:hypothetical protein